jgi:hypothetical protein
MKTERDIAEYTGMIPIPSKPKDPRFKYWNFFSENAEGHIEIGVTNTDLVTLEEKDTVFVLPKGTIVASVDSFFPENLKDAIQTLNSFFGKLDDLKTKGYESICPSYIYGVTNKRLAKHTERFGFVAGKNPDEDGNCSVIGLIETVRHKIDQFSSRATLLDRLPATKNKGDEVFTHQSKLKLEFPVKTDVQQKLDLQFEN